jgi:hypothetical protein
MTFGDTRKRQEKRMKKIGNKIIYFFFSTQPKQHNPHIQTMNSINNIVLSNTQFNLVYFLLLKILILAAFGLLEKGNVVSSQRVMR